jgi:hypothetical protein
MLGFGEIAFLGVAGACMFLGPKRIIPRIAETVKVARQTFAETGKAADSAVEKTLETSAKASEGAGASGRSSKSTPPPHDKSA